MANRPRKPTDADHKRAERAINALSRRDRAAVRRVLEWAGEEATGRVSPEEYSRLSGRQPKTFRAIADRYGVPLSGDSIDLSGVLKWFHSFLAEHGRKLFATSGEDPMSGETSPALELWREEKYKLARISRLEKEGDLIPRELLHETLSILAGILRKGGESIRKHFGEEALELFTEILNNVEREINSFLDQQEAESAE